MPNSRRQTLSSGWGSCADNEDSKAEISVQTWRDHSARNMLVAPQSCHQSPKAAARQLLAADPWAPGNPVSGAANSKARQGEEQSREWLKAAFSSWPSVTEQVPRNYSGSPQMKPFLGLGSSTGNTDVSRGSATVTVQHPFSQTLAFTGSRLAGCIKTQEVKAVSLPAQLPSDTNIEQ